MRNKYNVVLSQNLDKFLCKIGINSYSDVIRTSCPVHGGDNYSACVINGENTNFPNSWKCWTRNCHDIFGWDLFGLAHGYHSRIFNIWSSEGDRKSSFMEVQQWIEEFLCKDKQEILALENNKIRQPEKLDLTGYKFSRKLLERWLEIPSRFYLGRGYSSNILKQYYIGDCHEPGKFFKRAVIPIFDKDGFASAFSARSILKQCSRCQRFHYGDCPIFNAACFAKWNHNNLHSSIHFYNFYESHNWISQTKTALLLESPGNVLKLEDSNIHGSLGCFGAKLSYGQLELLAQIGVTNLVILFDEDEAGFSGARKIATKYGKDFNIIIPSLNLPTNTDIGDFDSKVVYSNITKVLKNMEFYIDKIKLFSLDQDIIDFHDKVVALSDVLFLCETSFSMDLFSERWMVKDCETDEILKSGYTYDDLQEYFDELVSQDCAENILSRYDSQDENDDVVGSDPRFYDPDGDGIDLL